MSETVFTEQPEKNQLIVERVFNGPVDMVWKCWTDATLLDKWWAPQPWKAVTKSMDFREGGHWHYCMQSPEGEQHWGRADYSKIQEPDYFEAKDAFCDEDGNVNLELPATQWRVEFTGTETGTRVSVITTFESQEAMKQLIDMGVKEGSKMAHDNLDALLKELLK